MSDRLRQCRMALWLVLLLIGAAIAANIVFAQVTAAGVVKESIRVTTTDGVSLTGALWKPPAGTEARPALLLVHGYGGNFAGWSDFAQAVAGLGYLTLALDMRDHGTGPKTSLFEDTRRDIEAGVKLLTERGIKRYVLAGQSLGTNRILYYQADTQDPRVLGLVLMAGPGNLLEWHIRNFGREKALAVVADAQQRIREGRGAQLMEVDLGPVGTALYSANQLVSLRGSSTRSEPYQNIARIETPMLIFHGTADTLVDPAVAVRLKAAAVASNDARLHMIPDAGHALPQYPDELLAIMSPWLEAIAKQ